MERVRGIGGIFFKATDPKALSAWYAKALGVPLEEFGGAIFVWHDHDQAKDAQTIWSPFANDTKYFLPSEKPFMLNFRVEHLGRMLDQIRAAGGKVLDETMDDDNGRFGWFIDPDGNKVELWEPKAST